MCSSLRRGSDRPINASWSDVLLDVAQALWRRVLPGVPGHSRGCALGFGSGRLIGNALGGDASRPLECSPRPLDSTPTSCLDELSSLFLARP